MGKLFYGVSILNYLKNDNQIILFKASPTCDQIFDKEVQIFDKKGYSVRALCTSHIIIGYNHDVIWVQPMQTLGTK